MLIVTMRTDKPEAEVGLYSDTQQLGYSTWLAHRELSVTIHSTILALLKASDKNWNDIQALVFYEGPGSFTGLRIGASLANALVSSNSIPIVSGAGEDWIDTGIGQLLAGADQKIAVPEYGAPARTTTPRK